MNALDALKVIDRRELLYLVLRDTEAKRVLVAWTIYGGCAPKHNDINDGAHFDEIIDAAWFGCNEVEFNFLGGLAGLSPRVVEQKFQALRNLGLIYPDGTANEKALAIVRAEVGGHIRSLAR